MRFRVADLLKSSLGRSRVVEIAEWPEIEGFDLTAPVTGELQLIRDPAGITVEGDLQTRARLACARCLKPVELRVVWHLSEHFRPTVTIPAGPPIEPDPEEEHEPITDLDAQHVLDLSGVLWQNLELALPSLPLCSPNCAGLCANCGADLNEGDCGCQPEPDQRWSALTELRAMMNDTTKDGTSRD